MARSRVRLPAEVRGSFEVYLNGVRQQLGNDYEVREGTLVFQRDLRKDKISGWRWLLGRWGVGHLPPGRLGGRPLRRRRRLPAGLPGLEIEPG